jgi:hypothetical protein
MTFCDNRSCIALFKDPKFHDHSKHIEIWYHYLHKQVETELLSWGYVSIESMFVDLLTKIFPKLKDCYCCGMLDITTFSTERGEIKEH